MSDYLDPENAPSREQVDRMQGLVVLEFGTAWCGYCQAFAPVLDEVVKQHPGVRHIKVEDGRSRPLGRSFGVRLWPNLVFLRDGEVVRQLARPDRDQLREALDALLG